MSSLYRSRKEVLKMPNQETLTVKTPFRNLSILDASRFSSIRRSRSLSLENDDPTPKKSLPSVSAIGTLALDIRIVNPQTQYVSTCIDSSAHRSSEVPMSIVPSCWTLLPQCPHMDEPSVTNTLVVTKSGQGLEKLRIFMGYDSREVLAYEVCRHSLLKYATILLEIIPLKLQNLMKEGIYTRSRDPTESTEFSFTRFLTPSLAGFEGWALFIDCDFLYTADVRELAELIDDQYAIMCVHHDYTPKTTVKMDGVIQTSYPRKNWSSMVLYNCSHPKNKLLTPELVNSKSGAFLHRFMWLENADIGEIPFTWNFLVGHNESPKEGEPIPKAIHFTCGGPWFEAWRDCEFADYWLKERDDYWKSQCAQRVVRHELLKLVNIRVHESTSRRNYSLGKSKQQKRSKQGHSIADFMCNALCL